MNEEKLRSINALIREEKDLDDVASKMDKQRERVRQTVGRAHG